MANSFANLARCAGFLAELRSLRTHGKAHQLPNDRERVTWSTAFPFYTHFMQQKGHFCKERAADRASYALMQPRLFNSRRVYGWISLGMRHGERIINLYLSGAFGSRRRFVFVDNRDSAGDVFILFYVIYLFLFPRFLACRD